MTGKLYFSSPVSAERAYANQTAILRWLESIGHVVEFVPNYDDGRRPQPRIMQVAPASAPVPAPGRPVKRRSRISPNGELIKHVGKPCLYCSFAMTAVGRHQATRDHKHPKSKGGMLRARNKIIACAACNNDKDAMTLDQWYESLKSSGDRRAEKVGYVVLEEGKGRPIRPRAAPPRLIFIEIYSTVSGWQAKVEHDRAPALLEVPGRRRSKRR